MGEDNFVTQMMMRMMMENVYHWRKISQSIEHQEDNAVF